MRELKRFTCLKCGKTFMKAVGGVVLSPHDQALMLHPVCDKCKVDKIADIFGLKK